MRFLAFTWQYLRKLSFHCKSTTEVKKRHMSNENTKSDGSTLTAADLQHLKEIDKKLQLVRDRVAGVVRGQPGMLLFGPGGIGKTYTVQEELRRLRARYRLLNTHVTGLSLFTVLERYPTYIHVLEDVEEVLRDRLALGVLRSATWPCRQDRRGNPECVVTWSSRGQTREIVFRGGIIVISNRRAGELPELKALETRLTTINLEVCDEELAAQMRRQALLGYRVGHRVLGAAECWETIEFVIEESARVAASLNMRLMNQAFEDRMQAEDHAAGLPWQDLVASRIARQPNVAGEVEAPGLAAAKLAEELTVAREIVGLPRKQRLIEWESRTGLSQATLYRRLGELRANPLSAARH